MSENQQPSVIRFEKAVEEKNYELSCNELLDILGKLDNNFGGIQGIEIDLPKQLVLEKDTTIYFCTRMSVAITSLFQDPSLSISDKGAQRFLTLQRWISMLFASSPFVNADHILRTYNRAKDKTDPNNIELEATKNAFIKFCILYLPESNITLNLDAMWNLDPELCASLCFALQSPRFIGTPHSFSKRAAILQWFPEKISSN